MNRSSTQFLGICSVVFFVFLSSCGNEESEDDAQQRIYAQYELFYNANSDLTWIVARFRFGGLEGPVIQLAESAL